MARVRYLFVASILAGLLLSRPASSQIKYFDGSSKPVAAARLPIAELTASDGVAGNALGIAVAVSDETVVVGENCLEIGGNPSCDLTHEGVVYVYQASPNGWTSMTQTAELTPSDGFVGDGFGTSVAIEGNTIVVGANGKVYVFVNSGDTWKDMTETAQLMGGVNGDGFGGAVAIDKGTIVVGAPNADIGGNTEQGAAYLFVEPENGWTTTSVSNAQLTASDGTSNDAFGFSVGVSGKTVVVGAPFHGESGEGEADVFVRPTKTGWATATETAQLTRSNPGHGLEEFGLSVAIDLDTIVIGAQQAVGENNGQGTVDVFVKPTAGWVNSTENAELVSPVSVQSFGESVAIKGSKVVIGAYTSTNLIFVFSRPKGGWVSSSHSQSQFTAEDRNSFFGFSVATDGKTVAVGAPFETVNDQVDQGAAYVFGK